MPYKKPLLIFISILWLLVPSGPAFSVSDGGIESLRQTGKAFASVARKVSPSVVFIQVESIREGFTPTPFPSPFGDDLFKRFFGDRFPGLPQPHAPQGKRRAMSQGSGFVFAVEKRLFSDKTYILTNSHVVEGADKIKVKFQDGREFDARIKGQDPKSDVAIIEIEADNLPAIPLGDSSKLEVGEWVVALGNPFGLSHTLTVGVVSAKGRTGLGINDYEDFIQTDAAINPGNSGGPLVNLDGEVIGINTAIFSRSGGYMGVGFAIPINLARNIAEQLIETGEVTRGFLGIVIQPLTPELADSFGIEDTRGILVAQVTEDTPAARAGLRAGDLIVSYQGKPVTDVGDFRNRVALTAPESTVQLTIIRNGKRKEIEVRIGELSDEKLLAQAPTQYTDELGLTVQTITPELARQFNATPGEGVIVTEVKPGSVAAMAAIRRGTVILQVNREPVNSATAFKQAVLKSRDDKRVLLLISDRRGISRFVVLRWR